MRTSIDGESYCNRCCKPLSKKGNAKISMTIYEDDDFIDTLETEKVLCCECKNEYIDWFNQKLK